MKALEHYVPMNDGFNVPSSPIRPSITQASLRHQGERDGGRRGMEGGKEGGRKRDMGEGRYGGGERRKDRNTRVEEKGGKSLVGAGGVEGEIERGENERQNRNE